VEGALEHSDLLNVKTRD